MKRSVELQETIALAEAASDRVGLRVSVVAGLTSLPEVSRKGNQVTLTSRNELRYQNESVSGRGGMGEVQLANDWDIIERYSSPMTGTL